MARTITVKGTGSVTTKPDYVVLRMPLKAQNMTYEKAMALASDQIAELTGSLEEAGFAREDVKTIDFKVSTNYENVKDEKGYYRKVFKGYEVSHLLKLGFDFETDRLSDAIAAISACSANPELKIRFTVKEPARVNKELLNSATQSAKEKAETICKAAGVSRGQLLRINYNWDELNVYSDTCYEASADSARYYGMDIEPDDIDVRDTVTFEWEIV